MLGMSGCSEEPGQAGPQYDEPIIVNTTIAVVNADMGAEVGGAR